MSVPLPPFQPVALAPKPIVQRALSDGRRVGLVTSYDPRINELMREIGGTWLPPRRAWIFVVDEFRGALERLAAAQLAGYSAVDARPLAVAAWQAPVADCITSALDLQVIPLESGGHVVSSARDPLVLRALRSLEGRYHAPARAWQVRRPRAEILAALADIAGVDESLVFVHQHAAVLQDMAGGGGNAMPISLPGVTPPKAAGAASAPIAQGSGFLSTIGAPAETLPVDEEALQAAARTCGLRDYQVAGVRHLLARSGALLADDMGLGKTRQAVVASRLAAGPSAVLIVCPASLGINWQREIRAVYPQADIAIVGQAGPERLRNASWIVATFERLGGLVRDPDIWIGVMTIDEAHALKESDAGRTRNAFLLAARVPRVFLLSGTPLLNREVELHTLLRLSGHMLGSLELGEFRRRYAGDDGRRQQLAALLADWMLRRGKDVLVDLGDKTRQVRYVEAPDGLAGYRAILADPTLQSMPKLTRLRQHLEGLKLDFLIDSLLALPGDAKALVFCEYMETVETLRQALRDAGIGCVSLVGSDTPKKRMAAVDALQRDPAVKVFIGTTAAAGVGITLTAANYVFFASMPWTPAMMRQAEDRAYRSGQTRDVIVIVPLVATTIDEQIFALLDSKREIEVDVIEANRAAVSA